MKITRRWLLTALTQLKTGRTMIFFRTIMQKTRQCWREKHSLISGSRKLALHHQLRIRLRNLALRTYSRQHEAQRNFRKPSTRLQRICLATPNPHFPEHQVVLSTDEIVAEPSLVDLVNETRSPMQLSKAIDAPTEDLFGDLDPEPLHEQAQYPIILEADEIVDEHSHVDSVHENLHTTTVLTTEPLHEELRIVAKDLTGLAQGDLNYDPRQNSPSIVEQSSQDADPVVSQDIPVVPSVEESEQPALESINMAASEFQETAIAEVDELQPIVEGSNRVPGAAATVENVEEAETVKPIVPFIEHDETSDTMKPSVQPVEPPTEDAAVVVEETPLVQPSEAFLPSPILVNDSSESIPIKDDNTTLPISTDSPRKPGLFFPDYEGEEPLSDEEPIQSDGFFSGQQYYVIESDEVDQLEDDEYDVGQIDARTISRSVSIDPAHQHFIVEERLTEEPEQQDDDTGVDIVALDELEPILEETPIEMQAEEATIPPSWSPSLPVHVPMPVLADPMALDPSEPTSPDEAELASSPKISTPLPASLLRAKHVSSLFTPAGSMPGTPTELDVEQAQLQSPQAVIVEESPEDAQTEVIPDKSEFTAPAISASSNTESLPAEAEPTIQSSVDIPTTAPPLRRQPSAPSLQSDPYPYSLSTPGDILINSEIEGIADSGPSTATESEAMSGSEETASAVTSYEISELEAKELESGDNSLVQDTIPVDLDTEEQAVEPAPPVQDLATDMPKVDLAEPMAEVTPTPLSTAVPETDETDGDANVPEAKPAATDEQASPTTESESGSLKRKRDDAEDDTLPSTRPNFGKVARSRLSGRGKGKRKGKGREDDDTSSSSSSADSAARLLEEDLPLSSVVGTPSDGGSSFVLESSPTHSRGKVIKVIRSQRSQSELAPTPPPPPPPPPLPPVLMHAHSHNRRPALPPRQSTQPKPRPPPLQATPSRGSFTMPLSPSTPSDLTSSVMTPAPIRKPTAAPVTAGTPMTRAHCRYHKVSLPENAGDDDDDDRSGPRRTFVVPGCSLTDTDLMKEENILDEGNATDVDGERMVGNVEYLGLSAYLIGVLRHLVGVDIMREGEVYYLPKEDEEVKAVAVAPSPQVPGSSQPLTREKSKMRASMSLADLPLSPATSVSSSRPPHSVAGSSSTASVSLSRRKRGGKRNGGSPAPSQIFSQDGGSDDENQSPAAKKIRAAELEGIRAATENSPLRTRRGTKRVDSESADYAPEAEEELDDDDEDEVQTKKKRKRNGKGEERKSKKLKMRESIGPAQ
ncbi:hypothetical protein MIND_00028200 [Mycena indigotica]|uniref:Uncharacterized protein n=1 Tax=Mycena indigotica TaxID=2126181 RepID=A0A8H6TD66_9AGAR|nr:uncharacterized protein MIND_00028200 [Mycena indigotica]KAF7315139.1 hypothetical protein MIND_00028200 [Mycena indigotica]